MTNTQTINEKLINLSDAFWTAMKNADGQGMYDIADPRCTFVHIGTNAGLDKEVKYYTDGIFQPTDITVHNRDIHQFGDTAIVLTDVDYGLMLDGKPTTHHFMVTEVYQNQSDDWKLIQFTFTALVY